MKTKFTLQLAILLISHFALAQWTAVNNGLPAATTRGVANVNGKLFTAVSGHGIYYSENLGVNWKIWERSGELPSKVYHKLVGNDFDLSGQESVFFSVTGDKMLAVYEDQASNSNSLSIIPLTGLSGDAQQIRSWSKHDSQNMFLVGTASGFHYTPKIGSTPFSLAAGLPAGVKINGCQIAGNDNEYIFAGTDGGVYRSSDFGKNFVAYNQGFAKTLRINYMSGLFTLTERGIYINNNAIGSFVELTNTGEGRTENIGDYKAYTFNPSNGKAYFFGNNVGTDLDMFVTFGLSNISLNGITDKDIIGTTIIGDYIFVSTPTSGVYRMSLNPLSVADFEKSTPKAFTVFPNPSNGQFTISSSDTLSIQLLDVTGKLIQTYTVDQNKEIQTNLKSGLYFLKDAQTGGTQKLLIK